MYCNNRLIPCIFIQIDKYQESRQDISTSERKSQPVIVSQEI